MKQWWYVFLWGWRSLLFVVLLTIIPRMSHSSDPTYEDLIDLILSKRITQIENLLPLLPETYRSQYVLMHHSRSKQAASWEAPRAILHGQSASLLLAFNGDPSLWSGNPEKNPFLILEVAQFRKPERRWEFRMIQFPQTPGDSVRFSEPNPKACMGCHRGHSGNPRPNWESYDQWVGAYGGDDDYLRDEHETRHLDRFIAAAKNHPRYQHLARLESSFRLRQLDHLYGRRTVGMHNSRFTQKLAELNFQNVSRQIQNSPHYAYFKYYIAAALAKCLETGVSLPEVPREIQSYIPLGTLPILDRFLEELPIPAIMRVQDYIEWIFEAQGISTHPWFTNFKNADNYFALPELYEPIFLATLAESDPDLLEHLDIVTANCLTGPCRKARLKNPREIACEALKELSQKTLHEALRTGVLLY